MSIDSLFLRLEAYPAELNFLTWINEQGESTQSLSFGEFRAQVALCTKALMNNPQLELTKGDAAVLMFEPGLQFYVTTFACFYAGIIVVPIYPPFPPNKSSEMEKVRRILADFLPGLKDGHKMKILCSKMVATSIEMAKLTQILSSEPIWKWVQAQKFVNIDSVAFGSAAMKYSSFPMPLPPTEDDISFIQYTSGSTGTPKGVINKYCHLMESFKQMNVACGAPLLHLTGRRETMVSWLPQYHDYGLIGVFLLYGIYTGSELNLMSPFTFIRNPLLWFETITNKRATVTASPNFGYSLVLKKARESKRPISFDLSSLKVSSCGAEPLQPEMFAEVLDFFSNFGFNSGAFCPCYGLAEHVLGITMVLPGTPMIITDGRVSCGPIFDEVDVKIVDPNTLKVVANGESGEIWASSPAKSGGYWNNPEATKQNFQATIEGSSAEYLRTGDLGFIADGNLYVSGRLKDIVIIQGKNYYANDIEIAAISSQEKYLRPGSTAAFSVESNDRDAPEKLVIVLELKESYLKASPEVLADISNSIRKDVSAATGIIVSHLLLVKPKAVPKTTSGKIMRRGTKEMFLNKRLSPVFQFPVIETEASTTNYFTAFQNLLPSSLFGSTPVSAAPKSHLQDPVQLRVAKVWSKVLQIPLESITSDSDFYALGGTSISTIAVINSLTQEDAGFRGMTFQMFMLNSNLESMANLWLDPSVERASTNDNEEDEETPEVLNKAVEAYEKELEELDDVSISSDGCLEFNASKIAESHNAVVLLTGANGFLGSGIVFSFMKQFPTIRLICQVRAKSKEHGVQRIKEAVEKFHGVWEDSWMVEVVLGDVTEPKLGLSKEDWNMLAHDCDVIIHNAAVVDFVKPYAAIRDANVKSTVEALRLAGSVKVKGVMFVSSVSAVQGKGSVPQAIPEDVNLKEMSGKFLFGYGQSKNVAEVLCARARARGIPTVSVRAGFVGGSTTTNVTNYDMMWDFIKTMKVRQVSLKSDDHIQITPVDYLAECVTKLVFSERFWTRSAVHLSPPLEKCITWRKASSLMKLSDAKNRELDPSSFTRFILNDCKRPTSPLFPYAPTIRAIGKHEFKLHWLVPTDLETMLKIDEIPELKHPLELWIGYLSAFFATLEEKEAIVGTVQRTVEFPAN